ncbi:hypothetical protein BO82DRAFT_31967 [Aspergillus uvarum CBS 121591]|uniref:Uncharacterized protein n=1 Tax=Aspergillus uvarum CBS 121591 TaxID=1448315 RepID=A0A319CIB6_9EURO|nr:hypothetical protein BO82DRAFT_31967 [Aspergillus uvarum CBS 121591]PYH84079.1 hypothetical protein BO82DRAFT_31967 [Aspergillus uvarum CBS 121591]
MVLNCHWQRAEVKKLVCAMGCSVPLLSAFRSCDPCYALPPTTLPMFPLRVHLWIFDSCSIFFLYIFSLISLSFFSTSLPIAAIPPGKNTSLLLPTHPHTTTNTIVKNDPLAWALTSEYLRNHGACHGWLHLSPVWRLIVRLSCVILDFISSRQASRNKLAIRDFRVGDAIVRNTGGR